MSRIDMVRLAGWIKMKQGKRGLREIAQEIGGVSPSTLSRIGKGKVPDIETFLRICDWLGARTEEFIVDSGQKLEETQQTLACIEILLRSDPKINGENTNAMMAIISTLYSSVVKQ